MLIFLLLCVTASCIMFIVTYSSLYALLLVPQPRHTAIQALLPVLNPLSSAAGSVTSALSPLVNTQVYNRENVQKIPYSLLYCVKNSRRGSGQNIFPKVCTAGQPPNEADLALKGHIKLLTTPHSPGPSEKVALAISYRSYCFYNRLKGNFPQQPGPTFHVG